MKLFRFLALFIKKFTSLLLLSVALCVTPSIQSAQALKKSKTIGVAVVKDPVIDMNNSFPPPFNAAASPDTLGCPRAHQGLYNEIVNCLDEKDEFVQIAYGTAISYKAADTSENASSFWTYKKHLIALKTLRSDLLEALPHPVYAEQPTIVLLYPWEQFSAGTRFKHCFEWDTDIFYAIEYVDHEYDHVSGGLIPRENAMPEIKQSPQLARALFVKNINDLVDRVTATGPENSIAYVWGGSSFLHTYKQPAFFNKDGLWHREGNVSPYTGYDCSGFILRMAHIVGIDFPWKTAATIAAKCSPLTEADQLKEGDIIWVRGHVMVVSSLAKNEIIEARGYSSGYGCVHRIALSECFEGINSYADLLERYHTTKIVHFKNKAGEVLPEDREFKLLKLM